MLIAKYFLLFCLVIPSIICIKRNYELEVRYIGGAPDGVWKDKVLGINGLFPGPAIVADINDTLVIKVVNNIQDGQNTSIHWHGLHQKKFPFQDGTNMIAQCPLKAGGNYQIYEFPVPVAGTFWYHAHLKSQYVEGLWGPLIVKNPKEYHKYDGEFIITIGEWYWRTAHELEEWHLSPASKGAPPFPDSALMNGRGRTNCTIAQMPANNFTCSPDLQTRPIFRVEPGKTYRIRVINVSGYPGFRFSIDNHKMRTIEVDSVSVRPTPGLDMVEIASAQRYSFLVTMNATQGDSFLIRADMMTETLFRDGPNINQFYESVMPVATGVLHYVRPGKDSVRDTAQTEIFDYNQPLPPDPLKNIPNPMYMDELLLHATHEVGAPEQFDAQYFLNVTFVNVNTSRGEIRHGGINGNYFSLPEDKPLLYYMLQNETIPEHKNPVYLKQNQRIKIIINNPLPGRHPFHFHGHSFWVLGFGKDNENGKTPVTYDPTKHNLNFHGVRRDTVVVRERSWAVIGFIANNPGVWAIHCHIDWHNLSGMAAIMAEAYDVWDTNIHLKIPAESRRVCAQHGIKV